MLKVSPVGGDQVAYRGPNEIDARQRVLALGAVAVLHAVVVGGFIYAQLRPPAQPPEPTLTVSFITETAAAVAPAPTPPQPTQATPTPPERQLLATPKPTASPMTAPPVELERRESPKAVQPAPAAPPANASPSASAPSPRTAGDLGATTTTPPNFSAAYLNNPRPVYPPAAKFRGRQGTVELRVQVGADGSPVQVLVSHSSGHSDLDAAALDVVKKRWRFVPAKQGDRAIVGWVIVPLEFSLTKNR